MLLTPHVLTGMLAGSLAPNFLLSPFYSLASYFLLEMIPHWDPEKDKNRRGEIIHYIDILFSISALFTVIIARDLNPKYIFGGLTSFILYFVFYYASKLEIKNYYFNLLKNLKNNLKYTDKSMWGILVQVSVCILVLTIIFDLIDFPTWDRIQKNIFVNILRLGS